MNIEKEVFNKVVLILLLLFITANLLFRFFAVQDLFPIRNLPFVLYIFGILSLVIYAGGIIYKTVKLDITDLIIGLLIIVGIISTIFAYSTHISIYGFQNRGEGLFTLITYYLLFLVSKNLDNRYKKIVIYYVLFSGFFALLYSVFQLLEFNFVLMPNLYISSVFGNANFNSSYMLMCLALSIGLYMYKNDDNKLHLTLIITYSLGLYLANSMSGIIGLGIVCFLILLTKNKKKIIITAVTLLSTFALYTIIIEDDLLHDIFNTANEATEVALEGVISDDLGTTRGYIWKETLKLVPNNIITGIGIDNFAYINDGEPINYYGSVFDKAHSELLQILATQGIFALVLYIILYIKKIAKHIKNEKTITSKIIFLLVISYIVQGIFNISVICVAPIFFIFLGLLEDIKLDNKKNNNYSCNWI